jgi:hypothetical protein
MGVRPGPEDIEPGSSRIGTGVPVVAWARPNCAESYVRSPIRSQIGLPDAGSVI